MLPELYWLPPASALSSELTEIELMPAERAWSALGRLSRTSLNSLGTMRVDRTLARRFGEAPPPGLETKPVRLALLASSTATHLVPGLRVAALRQGIWLTVYVCNYGQYAHELLDEASGLVRFQPDVVLFALDAAHLLAGCHAGAEPAAVDEHFSELIGRLSSLWRRTREGLGCAVLQQTVLPVFPSLLGSNEQRVPGSPARLADRLNASLREQADSAGVDLVAVDTAAARDGLRAWFDPVLWLRAKQEIHPGAAHVYGDLVGRLLAALQGRNRKCLVLDLDNTLWGGVIGDDGLAGIVLGQGHALGEAYVAFQKYAQALASRGVILAVCSKNDEATAWLPFDQHPDMVLRRKDVACLVANWSDKPSNIRKIAERLNIGLESIVFADDNPFERNIIRRELPMVAVPELPSDAAYYASCISDAGYFEATRLTSEDRTRSRLYQAHLALEQERNSTTDLDGYLQSLDMEIQWGRFDALTLPRVVQLINKTNQFNLTTVRMSEQTASAIMADPRSLALQLRLLDKYCDSGVIAVVTGRFESAETDLMLEIWLMSCRVFGRGVEQATLDLVVMAAKRLGAQRLIGEYRPTARNGIVRDHYARLGFTLDAELEDGATRWALSLDRYVASHYWIRTVEHL